MKQELNNKLVEQYPKIFSERFGDVTTTAMCWGFECGDGWYEIINNLCNKIQDYLSSNPKVPQVIAKQVKEKFGGLRFYIEGGDDKIYSFINEAEQLSYKTCEYCGSTNNVKLTKKGWIRALCEEHYPKD